jgi:hypothetical protein
MRSLRLRMRPTHTVSGLVLRPPARGSRFVGPVGVQRRPSAEGNFTSSTDWYEMLTPAGGLLLALARACPPSGHLSGNWDVSPLGLVPILPIAFRSLL